MILGCLCLNGVFLFFCISYFFYQTFIFLFFLKVGSYSNFEI